MVASPVAVGDVVVAPTRVRPMLALRAFGRGDVTKSHLLWTFDRGPDVPTPATDGKHLYVVTDKGVLWCLDLATGKPYYGPERLAVGTYSASPLLADGKLYLTNEDGLTTVVKAGPAFERLAENPLDGFTVSSPAAAAGPALPEDEGRALLHRRRALGSGHDEPATRGPRGGLSLGGHRRGPGSRQLAAVPGRGRRRGSRTPPPCPRAGRPPTTSPGSADVPGRGWSSPIVWGDRVYVTTAVNAGSFKAASTGIYGNDYAAELKKQGLSDDEILKRVTARDIELASESEDVSYEVLALDARTGKVVWQREAHRGKPSGGRHRKNTYASETPATDGERVYASFGGNVGLFCYSREGTLVWKQTWAASAHLPRLRHRVLPRGPRRARVPAPRQRGRVVPRGPGSRDGRGGLEGEPHGERRAPEVGVGDTFRLGERPADGDRDGRSRPRDQLRHGGPGALAPEGHHAGDTEPSRGRGPALRGLRVPG